MSGYLLDTNVVSELRRVCPHGGVLAWIRSCAPDHLHVCAVTVLEIQRGVELTRVQDPARAASMERWLDDVVASYPVIAVDGAMFRLAARWGARSQLPNFEDTLIAAVACERNLTLATRNTRDFQQFAVPLLDPFAATSPDYG